MKTTVIYHSADFDGIFCREIARKFLPDAELIGWNFGEPTIPLPQGRRTYILDLPPDCVTPWPEAGDDRSFDDVIWIDHHKTSIDKWLVKPNIPGYRIDGVAACRLAWQWFVACLKEPSETCNICGETYNLADLDAVHFHMVHKPLPDAQYSRAIMVCPGGLPEKQDFVDRKVSEPLAVRLAGEYDIWDKRDPRAETFQYGLRCYNDDNVKWDKLLDETYIGEPETVYLFTMLVMGDAAQRYAQNIDADLVTHRSYRLNWEGLNWLVLNTGKFNSLTFAALDVPETGHDALLGYIFNGKVWTVSLYHAKHRTDLDLSEIAKRYGGGGHKGACGFTSINFPFNLIKM